MSEARLKTLSEQDLPYTLPVYTVVGFLKVELKQDGCLLVFLSSCTISWRATSPSKILRPLRKADWLLWITLWAIGARRDTYAFAQILNGTLISVIGRKSLIESNLRYQANGAIVETQNIYQENLY